MADLILYLVYVDLPGCVVCCGAYNQFLINRSRWIIKSYFFVHWDRNVDFVLPT